MSYLAFLATRTGTVFGSWVGFLAHYYYFVIALLATAVGTVQPRLRTD